MNRDFPQLNSSDSIDAEYRFGRPKVYLAAHELARLTLLRSKLGDCHAERLAYAAGTRANPGNHPAHPNSDLDQDRIWPE